jgi:uncharacterized protein
MSGDLRDHQYITTYTGRRFNYLEPAKHDFSIDDIAHSLSLTARFRGHTRELYSVAEHSIVVQRLLARQGYFLDVQLAGLLHDAHEAYFGDAPSPMKWAFPAIAAIEDQIKNAFRSSEICRNVGYAGYAFSLTKPADLAALHVEACTLFITPPIWADRSHLAHFPEEERPRCLTAPIAEQVFLQTYLDLYAALDEHIREHLRGPNVPT